MPRVEGRELKDPITDARFIGPQLVIRIDDLAASAFWLSLAFTPEEFGQLLAKYERHLLDAGNLDALRQLMLGKV